METYKNIFLTISALFTYSPINPMQRIHYLSTPYRPKLIVKNVPSEQISKKCNNIIMILDPLHQEKSVKGFMTIDHAMTGILHSAIQGQKIPILTTKSIARNFCIEKSVSNKMIWERTETDDSELIHATFTNHNWHCLIHKYADLVLLVPKNYVPEEMNSRSLKEQMAACGFEIDPTNFNLIKEMRIKNMWPYLNTDNDNIDIIDAIKRLFITQPSDTLSWNMYITGHGGPSYTKKTLADLLQKYPPEEQLSRDNSFYRKKRINQDLNLLDEAKNLEENTLIPNSGQIAGLITNDFLDLLSFFNKKLKMSFVHYCSCYSTGTNLALINDALANLKVNFIVSCAGVTEQTSNVAKASSKTNLMTFFSQLCNFFNNTDLFITNLKTNTRFINNPIESILNLIVNPNEHALVRIPSVGIFTPTAVGKKLKFLTNSIIKAHAFENKSIDCTNPHIQTVVVYSSYIGTPLHLNNRSDLVLALPQNFDATTKRKVCVFEEINSPNSIKPFLRNLTARNVTRTHITFVIKKLKCLDENKKPIVIENMVFSTIDTKTLSMSSFESEKSGFFSIDNNVYRISYDNNSAHFSPLKNFLPSELVSQVIDLEDMEDITPAEMTLPNIIGQLEKKTSKDWAVQQPGALKKVLEQKIIESINKKSPGSVQSISEEKNRIVEKSQRMYKIAEEIRQFKPVARKIESE